MGFVLNPYDQCIANCTLKEKQCTVAWYKFGSPKNVKNDRFFMDSNHLILEQVRADPADAPGADEEDCSIQDQGAHDPPVVETVDEDDEGPGARGEQRTRYNLRECKEHEGGFTAAINKPHSSKLYYPPHQFVHTEVPAKNMNEAELERFLFSVILVQVMVGVEAKGHEQMTAKAGIKKHGREAEEALMAEFAQLEDHTIFEGIDPSTVTTMQKRNALRAINLITEKQDRRLKGCTVADRRPQKSLYDKSETAMPMVLIDALMLLLMINAKEGQGVATTDVAGAYLKAFHGNDVHWKIHQDIV
jgi:hypothetical protein